ncbi:MAG: LysR family transcriptional regulator [Emcibacteraceae bacterium]|nr:LysR family transcriptional regulator [Emcibacteraceae bacterium]MDG1857644.1 LysR family transcriptional regulator [Emcibacteraceae bacterium]
MIRPDLNLSALRALLELEKTGSVSQTAIQLGVTQPAVSRMLARLEKNVGLDLFRRDTRPITLTLEGNTVAAFAKTIDGTVAVLEERLKAYRNNKKGSVSIGSFGASASTGILPATLKMIERIYPDIELKVIEADDDLTIKALRDGLIDMAVIAETNDEFETIPVTTDSLIGLIPKAVGAELPEMLKPSDLVKERFIMPLGGSEQSILNWFGDYRSQLTISHRILQTHSILAMVGAGLGCSIVSKQSLPISTSDVSYIPLDEVEDRKIVFARKFGSPSSKAANSVWQQIEQHWHYQH